MHDGYDSDEDTYQYRSLRERATESHHELHSSLASSPSISPAQRRHHRSRRRVKSPELNQSRRYRTLSPPYGLPTDHSDYSYGAAVSRLRGLLYQLDTDYESKSSHHGKHKFVQFTPPPRRATHYYSDSNIQAAPVSDSHATFMQHNSLPRGDIPQPEEVLPLLQNQSVLLQQIEAEKTYLKDEMSSLKLKLKDVIEENRMLHEELKKSIVHEILKEESTGAELLPKELDAEFRLAASSFKAADNSVHKTEPLGKNNAGFWKVEMERIQSLHSAKASRLEMQLQSAREESRNLETEVDDLKTQLRMQQSLAAGTEGHRIISGLCIGCGQKEAIMSTASISHKHNMEILTRERDDLVTQLAASRSKQRQIIQREDEMYLKLKQSTEMVEQAQLERTQVMVQKEQLQGELDNIKQRLEQYTKETQESLLEERSKLRDQTQKEREDFNKKINELSETLATTQLQLDKVSRDKVSLLADLENTKGHISAFDSDYNQATDSMKMSITTASVERNAAVRELKHAKQEIENLHREYDNEKQRLRMELVDVRRRLDKAEKELVEAKEETIHLTSIQQTLEREVHLAKLAKDSVEKNRSDDLKVLALRAEKREEELSIFIEKLENKHAHNTTELDEMFASQSKLVQQLKHECRDLTNKLEAVTNKYKTDNKSLKRENGQLKTRLNNMKRRLGDIEDQNHKQGSLNEKMRERLREMDQHSQAAGQQVLELLNKESRLMRDRLLLAREVEFLRNSVLTTNPSDFDKIYSPRRIQVDDILNTLQHEMKPPEHEEIIDKNILNNDLIADEGQNLE